MTIPFAGFCRLKLQIKKPQAVSACGFKKNDLFSAIQAGRYKNNTQNKNKICQFCGWSWIFPFYNYPRNI
ncbi:hypothetical protein DO021_07595 [Desulfobacter hydrogenophilus]|uniref:Uncharacterized protein n=1 Tax=Desulfobacter hydrogenophilus TaxID=2291 RepID=A0A328FDJ6_9BACT|nr:hypothetical protein DO021_07595 [Desulfobacter hydrogenophilus]